MSSTVIRHSEQNISRPHTPPSSSPSLSVDPEATPQGFIKQDHSAISLDSLKTPQPPGWYPPTPLPGSKSGASETTDSIDQEYLTAQATSTASLDSRSFSSLSNFEIASGQGKSLFEPDDNISSSLRSLSLPGLVKANSPNTAPKSTMDQLETISDDRVSSDIFSSQRQVKIQEHHQQDKYHYRTIGPALVLKSYRPKDDSFCSPSTPETVTESSESGADMSPIIQPLEAIYSETGIIDLWLDSPSAPRKYSSDPASHILHSGPEKEQRCEDDLSCEEEHEQFPSEVVEADIKTNTGFMKNRETRALKSEAISSVSEIEVVPAESNVPESDEPSHLGNSANFNRLTESLEMGEDLEAIQIKDSVSQQDSTDGPDPELLNPVNRLAEGPATGEETPKQNQSQDLAEISAEKDLMDLCQEPRESQTETDEASEAKSCIPAGTRAELESMADEQILDEHHESWEQSPQHAEPKALHVFDQEKSASVVKKPSLPRPFSMPSSSNFTDACHQLVPRRSLSLLNLSDSTPTDLDPKSITSAAFDEAKPDPQSQIPTDIRKSFEKPEVTPTEEAQMNQETVIDAVSAEITALKSDIRQEILTTENEVDEPMSQRPNPPDEPLGEKQEAPEKSEVENKAAETTSAGDHTKPKSDTAFPSDDGTPETGDGDQRSPGTVTPRGRALTGFFRSLTKRGSFKYEAEKNTGDENSTCVLDSQKPETPKPVKKRRSLSALKRASSLGWTHWNKNEPIPQIPPIPPSALSPDLNEQQNQNNMAKNATFPEPAEALNSPKPSKLSYLVKKTPSETNLISQSPKSSEFKTTGSLSSRFLSNRLKLKKENVATHKSTAQASSPTASTGPFSNVVGGIGYSPTLPSAASRKKKAEKGPKDGRLILFFSKLLGKKNQAESDKKSNSPSCLATVC